MNATTGQLPAQPLSLLVDAREVGRMLGLGYVTVHRWDSAGKLPAPALRKPGCTRWSRAEIEEWIQAQCPERAKWDAMQGRRRRGFGA